MHCLLLYVLVVCVCVYVCVCKHICEGYLIYEFEIATSISGAAFNNKSGAPYRNTTPSHIRAHSHNTDTQPTKNKKNNALAHFKNQYKKKKQNRIGNNQQIKEWCPYCKPNPTYGWFCKCRQTVKIKISQN